VWTGTKKYQTMNTERIEILINRALDGELSAADRRELDDALANNESARALMQEYEALDRAAGVAIHADFEASPTSATTSPLHYAQPPRWHGLRTGISAALFAAAAMIVVASLPWSTIFPSNKPQDTIADRSFPPGPRQLPTYQPMQVDYRRPAYQPQQLRGDVYRDVIGIRGDNPNVIIILERETHAARLDPLVGDF